MSHKPHSWLPDILQEIAELIGNELVLKLAEIEGGRRRYIPAKADTAHWLINAVGIEAAVILCDYFHYEEDTGRAHEKSRGLEIHIPRGPTGYYNSERQRINQALDALERKDCSAAEIAQALGTTERSVYRRRARRRTHNSRGQAVLF
jgi:hypothetical protein